MYLARTGDALALAAGTFQQQFIKLNFNNQFFTGLHDDGEA